MTMMINDALAEISLPAQTTDTVLLISPDTFQYNDQTADTNTFQKKLDIQPQKIQQAAIQEFQAMVATLSTHHIRVITLPSRNDVVTPDAVFPNNWFSIQKTHDGQTVLVLYPMLTESRRAERQVNALKSALQKHGIIINKIIDLTYYEAQHKALEGTGSLVLDHNHHIAYTSLSPRTDSSVLDTFAKKLNYLPITFHSYDQRGKLIYHTNVMLSIGSQFVVICSSYIKDSKERDTVLTTLRQSHRTIIEITPSQLDNMAGNIIEVKGTDGKNKIILSETAANAFTPKQLATLKHYGELIIVKIDTIEKIGGGSARCMLAEIFY